MFLLTGTSSRSSLTSLADVGTLSLGASGIPFGMQAFRGMKPTGPFARTVAFHSPSHSEVFFFSSVLTRSFPTEALEEEGMDSGVAFL